MTPAPNRPVAGVLWMLLTGICFVAVTAIVKHVGASLPSVQAAFLRFAFGFLFLLPMARQMTSIRLSPAQIGLFSARGVLHAAGVLCWFYAMTQITIAEVTAMNYMAPVYVTIGAALFLGETFARRRILAVIAAFIGAMIILRPGFRDLTPGHLAMVFTAIFLGGSYILAKRLSGEVNAAAIVGLLSVIVAILIAPFAYLVWVPPTAAQLGWLFAVAFFATAGHYAMTLAFAAAPVTVTQPVTFVQLVWAVAVGALVFGEPLDGWVILGGTIILAAVSFITWREHVLKTRAITPVTHATKV